MPTGGGGGGTLNMPGEILQYLGVNQGTNITGGQVSAGAQGQQQQATPPPPPQTQTDWAVAILLALGINPSPGAIQALIAQMHVEGMALTYNNPLAITNPAPSASPLPGNPAGVQTYSNWLDGLAGTVADIQANPTLIEELQAASPSCAGYAAALARATWEGSSPGANSAYANSVGQSCGTPVPALSAAWQQWLSKTPGWIQAIGAAIADAAKAAATAPLAAASVLEQFYKDVTNVGFWKRVALGAGGILLFGIGLVIFLSSTKEGEKVTGDLGEAAPVAALAA